MKRKQPTWTLYPKTLAGDLDPLVVNANATVADIQGLLEARGTPAQVIGENGVLDGAVKIRERMENGSVLPLILRSYGREAMEVLRGRRSPAEVTVGRAHYALRCNEVEELPVGMQPLMSLEQLEEPRTVPWRQGGDITLVESGVSLVALEMREDFPEGKSYLLLLRVMGDDGEYLFIDALRPRLPSSIYEPQSISVSIHPLALREWIAAGRLWVKGGGNFHTTPRGVDYVVFPGEEPMNLAVEVVPRMVGGRRRGTRRRKRGTVRR
jgi:hypothetical protein